MREQWFYCRNLVSIKVGEKCNRKWIDGYVFNTLQPRIKCDLKTKKWKQLQFLSVTNFSLLCPILTSRNLWNAGLASLAVLTASLALRKLSIYAEYILANVSLENCKNKEREIYVWFSYLMVHPLFFSNTLCFCNSTVNMIPLNWIFCLFPNLLSKIFHPNICIPLLTVAGSFYSNFVDELQTSPLHMIVTEKTWCNCCFYCNSVYHLPQIFVCSLSQTLPTAEMIHPDLLSVHKQRAEEKSVWADSDVNITCFLAIHEIIESFLIQ